MTKPATSPQTSAIEHALRSFHGPMTAELVQSPGDFGLGKIPSRLKPDDTTTSVCGFCSTGCGLKVHLKDGQAVNLSPETSYPVNLGMACPKGWEALTPLAAKDRATTPLLRNDAGVLEPVDWERALTLFSERFKDIQHRHGAHSVAWIGTGQICVEELAFLGALGKFGMGLKHGDGNTRQCMATAVTAYKESFGFDAPPFTYADFEASDVLVFVGANPCIAHPIMWQRVLRNKNKPEIIVVDPRRTETAVNATQHLPLKPKSDLTLLYGLAHLLIENGWLDEPYVARSTTGFEEFREFVHRFTPDMVASETGLTVGQIYRCAESIHRGKAVSFWWTMGVNQSHEATRTAQAIINLALMTGNIGRPGTGANSITGQCNAMGSRLFSNTTNLIGGHDFKNPVHRTKVAGVLGIDESLIPDEASWAYDQIMDGIDRGEIKGLWIIATNTAHSWINQKSVPELFKKLEFLVVQDMYATTETALLADLVLPAAGWGEKDGTLINSERRFGLVKKVSRAPGQALNDFAIFRLIAHYWGCGGMFANWTSPEAVFRILQQLSAGQPCDITGIEGYRMLDERGGVQWPWAAAVADGVMELGSDGVLGAQDSATPALHHSAPAQERRLFADGKFYTPDERARFIFEAPRPVAEPTSPKFPFILLTGRGTSAQWHTNTRTEKSAVLRMLYPAKAYVEIHPDDADRLGIEPNSQVEIISLRARITATAYVTGTVQPGQVFMPMHYVETNQLTHPTFDPYSRQPSYKHCAVNLKALSDP
jgi:assimilatory nitrate reductase catalytic subunit